MPMENDKSYKYDWSSPIVDIVKKKNLDTGNFAGCWEEGYNWNKLYTFVITYFKSNIVGFIKTELSNQKKEVPSEEILLKDLSKYAQHVTQSIIEDMLPEFISDEVKVQFLKRYLTCIQHLSSTVKEIEQLYDENVNIADEIQYMAIDEDIFALSLDEWSFAILDSIENIEHILSKTGDKK
jgi:hypothetical protein